MLNRLFTGLALTLLFTLGACEKSQKAEGAKEKSPTEATSTTDPAPSTAAQAEPAKAPTQSGEIVFNPIKPQNSLVQKNSKTGSPYSIAQDDEIPIIGRDNILQFLLYRLKNLLLM